MATATHKATKLIIEYAGEGDKSGGTYSNSSIKPAATAAGLLQTAEGVGDLQTKTTRKVYKDVETELAD